MKMTVTIGVGRHAAAFAERDASRRSKPRSAGVRQNIGPLLSFMGLLNRNEILFGQSRPKIRDWIFWTSKNLAE